MVHKKIENLLDIDVDFTKPKYSTKKWIEIFDQPNGLYNPNEDIRFKTSQLRNDLCDFNGAYIFLAGKITAANPDPPDDIYYGREIALKNSAPCFSSKLRINSEKVDFCDDLDVVMPMYSLLYYSKNFRKTTGSLWNYYPDIPSSEYVGNNERTKTFYFI